MLANAGKSYHSPAYEIQLGAVPSAKKDAGCDSRSGQRSARVGLSALTLCRSHMPDEERRIIKALLDGMIIKYQTKQMMGNLSS